MSPCMYICCHCELEDCHSPARKVEAPGPHRRASYRERRHSRQRRHGGRSSRSRSRTPSFRPQNKNVTTDISATSVTEAATEQHQPHTRQYQTISKLHQKLDSEHQRYDRRISALRQSVREEQVRHGDVEMDLRGRLRALDFLRNIGQDARAERMNEEQREGNMEGERGKKEQEEKAQKKRKGGSEIVRWMEGVRSISSFTSEDAEAGVISEVGNGKGKGKEKQDEEQMRVDERRVSKRFGDIFAPADHASG